MSRTFLSTTLRAAALGATMALSGAAVSSIGSSARAAAPMVGTQAPGFYRLMLGGFEVTALNDGIIPLDAEKLLHEPAARTRRALGSAFLGNPVDTSDNAFLVNTGSRLVLIDTGGGALLGPTLGKLLTNLRAAGYRPEQVDDVLLTHMHPDHVGGLMADGALAFPNATVRADRRDSDYWLSKANLDKAPAEAKGFFQGAVASLEPYVKAGRYRPFDHDGEVVPGVRSIASYGHTKGHTSYLVKSQGKRLILVGDSIHVAAVQLPHPEVTIAFDTDATAAAKSRKAVFSRAAADADLVGADHLQFPGLGHLRANGRAWIWTPVNYSTQLH